MKINGVDISTKDLILTRVPPIVKPQKRVRRITIPGRSGFLTEWSGDYESYIKEPEFVYTGSDIDDALTFLQSASLAVFPNETDYAYEVRADEKIEAVLQPSGIYKITATYITQPLKRLATEVASTGDTSYSLTNLGTEPAYPKLVVTGAEEKTVTVGTQTLTIAFDAGGETITIDSLNGQIYDAGGANAWGKVTGDLPVIPVSSSAITVSTTGSALTVYPNWRWS